MLCCLFYCHLASQLDPKPFKLVIAFGCPSSILSELSIIFNFTVLHSISPFCTTQCPFFCTGEIALIIDLGLINMFSANQTAEISVILSSLVLKCTAAYRKPRVTIFFFNQSKDA